MTMLTIENLCVWFGGGRDRVDAVRQASFHVERGASFGLVGESGSGKSTILRAIMGLAPNWSGRISVDGQPVTKKRQKGFYKPVQMGFKIPMPHCIRVTPWIRYWAKPFTCTVFATSTREWSNSWMMLALVENSGSAIRINCQADNDNALLLPVLWPPSQVFYCWMNQRLPLTYQSKQKF